MLKVLVDEDMPRPVVSLLKSLDIDAADVRDVGLKGSTDAEVFRYALENGMIFLCLFLGFRHPSRTTQCAHIRLKEELFVVIGNVSA